MESALVRLRTIEKHLLCVDDMSTQCSHVDDCSCSCSSPSEIVAKPLTAEDYRAYGSVIEAVGTQKEANQGTAQRFNWLVELENLRPQRAKPNLCAFRSKPRQLPFTISLLERHEFSTQLFSPMNATRYLVVVSLGGDKPDLSTLKAFVAKGNQGISYKPGVWHHPMITLDKETDFTCLVWEDGTSGDCEVVNLEKPIVCHVVS